MLLVEVGEALEDGFGGALGGAQRPLVLVAGARQVRSHPQPVHGLVDLLGLMAQRRVLLLVLGGGALQHEPRPLAVLLGHPGGQALQAGGGGGESTGEGGGQDGAIAGDALAEGGDEGAGGGRAQCGARVGPPALPAGDGRVALAGHGVDDVGDELAAQDLLGAQVGRGRRYRAVEHLEGVFQEGQLVGAPRHVGQGQG